MKITERWRASTEPGRFEAYTWWSIVVLLWFVVLLLVSAAGSAADGVDEPFAPPIVEVGGRRALAVMAVVGILHCIACQRVARDSLDIRLARGTARRWSTPLLALTTLLAAAACVLILPTTTDFPAGRALMVVIVAAAALSTLGARWPVRRLWWVTLTAAVLCLAADVGLPGFAAGNAVAVVIRNFFLIAGLCFTRWVSFGTVVVVRRLERARDVEARLAVAEERLRFSRDLHDTVGRSLSAIAVKSELAAELANRGRPEAAAEMVSVRDLAHDVLAEVRSVAAGYRRVSLAEELDGARSLLRSTGAVTTVESRIDVDAVDDTAQEALAWAVREGVTNVVRHSDARNVTLSLDRTGQDTRLTITNDAVNASPDDAASDPGSGLAGLRDRLRHVGGTLATERALDTFTLRVTVPGPTSEEEGA
jgi:two-component system sensor histidine kinase DesK